jgi:hypothetical protein
MAKPWCLGSTASRISTACIPASTMTRCSSTRSISLRWAARICAGCRYRCEKPTWPHRSRLVTDVTEEIARELWKRCGDQGEVPRSLLASWTTMGGSCGRDAVGSRVRPSPRETLRDTLCTGTQPAGVDITPPSRSDCAARSRERARGEADGPALGLLCRAIVLSAHGVLNTGGGHFQEWSQPLPKLPSLIGVPH